MAQIPPQISDESVLVRILRFPEFLSEGESSCRWFWLFGAVSTVKIFSFVGEENVLETGRPKVTEQFFRALQPVLLGLVRQHVSLQ